MHPALCKALILALVPTAAETRAQTIAPYLDELTMVVARIDLEKFDADAFAKLPEMFKLDGKPFAEHVRFAGQAALDLKEAGAREVFVVYSLAEFLEGPFVLVPLESKANAKAVSETLARGRLRAGGEWGTIATLGNSHAVVLGPTRAIERLRKLKLMPTPRPEVVKGFGQAGDAAIQIVLMPTTDTRRVVEELMPNLPPNHGGAPITTLTKGILWAAVGVDTKPAPALTLYIQSESPAAAQALRGWIVNMMGAIALHEPGIKDYVANLDQLAKALTPTVHESSLVVTLNAENMGMAKVAGALSPALRDKLDRDNSAKSLRSLGIAVHSYHDTYAKFPTRAIPSKDGKPLLSWRVALLPYLDQVTLYKEFRLDEPWDSEHNKKLIEKMPALFRSPYLKEPGKTCFLAPRGESTMWPGKQALKFSDVLDGTSLTILIVEAAKEQAVIWTKPDDFAVDLDNPHKGLTGAHPSGFMLLTADGSVRLVKKDVDKELLRAAFTRNGGEGFGLP